MDRETLNHYYQILGTDVESAYSIPKEDYTRYSIKKGLRNEDGTGVPIGITNIGSVQGYYMEDGEKIPEPGHLYYRGIDVCSIVDVHQKNGTFGYEEVAYLLLFGKLPNQEQLDTFKKLMGEARPLPDGFFEDMILKVSGSNVMNVLPRCVLALYNFDEDPENLSLENLLLQSINLIARFPGIVATAYAAKRHHYDHKSLYVHNPKPELSTSENFLRMLRPNKEYTAEEAQLLDLMLILHAEHGGGNNSTFTCRSLSSTLTDTYSAIAGAVCSLKGPLHGGANGKVQDMVHDVIDHVHDIHDDDEVHRYLTLVLNKKAGDLTGKLYGLGHAVYTLSDPRAVMIKKYAFSMAKEKGMDEEFHLLDRIERIGISCIREQKNIKEPLCANVDLYSGFVYKMLGIPQELFTPLFATARISGWCAHRVEEITTCKRIMRPAYRAPLKRISYTDISTR